MANVANYILNIIRGHIIKNIFLLISMSIIISACTDPAKDRVKEGDIIKGAIVKYDAALMKAYRNLDVREMSGYASQKEIEKIDSIFIAFIKDKVIMESDLINIIYEDLIIISPKEADVRVKETWRWRHIDVNTRKEVKPWLAEEQHIIYHMLKKDDLWIVNSLEFVKD